MNDSPALPNPRDDPAPRVSIVIPTYNGERFLAQTLQSIQAQTVRDWECVVVDDGSTDATLQIAREYAAADPRIRVVTRPNGGIAAARGSGFAATHPRSRYLTFLDSDDLWIPEALEVLLEAAERHPEAVGVHALGRCIDQHGAAYLDPNYARHGGGRFVCDRWGRPVRFGAAAPTTFRSLWFSNPFPPGLVLSRRGAVERAGPFDASVTPVEDWDMLIRLSRFGDFHFVESVIISYRRHPHNVSAQSEKVAVQRIRNMMYKTFFSPENDAAQHRIVRQNWRASELLHLRQKARAAFGRFFKGEISGAISDLASAGVHLCRFARGYPTRRGL